MADLKVQLGFVLALLTMGVSVYAQSAEDLLSGYEESLNQYSLALEKRNAELRTFYLEALERLFQQSKAHGDLDRISEIQTEKQWVKEGRDLPVKEQGFPELKAKRAIYLRAETQARLKWAGDVVLLTRRMDEVLQHEETGLVRSGKIENAKRIRDQRDQLFTREEVREAQWLVAGSGGDADQQVQKLPVERMFPDMPAHAVRFDMSYYAGFEEAKTWSEANRHCKDLGGALVSIGSVKEQEFVAGIVKKMGAVRTHIGATDQGNEGKWRWIDGTEWGFEHWGENQPDNGNGKEHTGAMYRDGRWLDIPAKLNCPYICEWGR